MRRLIDGPPASSADTVSSQTSTITSRTQITRLLSHLQDLQCPVTIEIKDLPRQRRQILAINPDASYLMLDLKIPKGRPFPASGQPVRLTAEFHGEEAVWATRVLESADMAGKALLRIHLPQSIDYRRRRAFYRVLLDTETRIPVTLIGEENGNVCGSLEDISPGGLATRIPGEGDGSQIRAELCLVQLPGDEVFHSELEITNTRNVGNDSVRVGARFHRTNDAQLRKLERFIRQIEREQLQKRP